MMKLSKQRFQVGNIEVVVSSFQISFFFKKLISNIGYGSSLLTEKHTKEVVVHVS